MGLFDRLRRATGTKTAGYADAEAAPGVVCSPATGRAMPLSDVPDPVFAQGALGKGFGVKPSEGIAFAPVSGMVGVAFPTGHAFGISGDDGTEVLVHVGVDTVDMDGDGFEPLVQKGDHVRAGQPLVRFSPERIAAAGHSDVVITTVTNSDAYESVRLVAQGDVVAGSPALRVSKGDES